MQDVEDPRAELLDLLEDLAHAGEVCPNVYELAAHLRTSLYAVRLGLTRLREAGVVDWRTYPIADERSRVRVVTILASGLTTKLPAACEKVPTKADDVLEAAKTVLRRKGYITYNAEVTDGLRGRGLTRVDHRRLDRDAVLAMAAKVRF